MTSQWQTVLIKNVYVGMFDGPHATPKPSESGPIFLGIKNVGDGGQIDLSNIRHISEEEYPQWTKRVEPRYGDIVFSYEATLNRYALIPKGFRGCLGRRMALIRPDESKTCGRFLFYYFFSKEWRNVIAQNTLIGSTVDRIPIAKFPDFPITIPPLPAQRKIASILSAYDDLIENNLRRIKILEDMAQSLYREWFVKFRFPSHEKTRMVDSPLGKIPEGWEVNKVGGLLKKIKRKKRVKKQDYELDAAIPVVDQGRDFIGGYTSDLETLHDNPLPIIVFGDHTRVLKYVGFPFACGADGTQLLLPNTERMPTSLFFYALRSIDLSDFAYARHFKFLKEQGILVPDEQVAQSFAQVADPIRDQIRCLLRRNATLRHTRDLLLPKLISGELDVSDLDIKTGGQCNEPGI